MDQNQQMGNSPLQPTPQMPGDMASPLSSGHKKVGPIVAALVIILVVVIAGLYLFASKVNRDTLPVNNAPTAENVSNPQSVSVPVITSTSDSPTDLQADLNNSTSGLNSDNF